MVKTKTSENLTQQKTIEAYLKTIYSLEEQTSPVSTSRIAAARDIKPASATNMVQRLDRLGYVTYKKRRGVTLTGSGRLKAVEMIRHHRLLELYLTEVLGFEWHEVHDEAERLEHVISDKLEDRIAEALDHPILDPHGAAIPAKDGTIPARTLAPIIHMEVGASAELALISEDNNRELLCYLADLGLKPGVRVKVLEAAPFEGPITVEVGGQQKILGYKAARALFVTPLE